MSSISTSQGMVLATAMAAVSGTVILLVFRHQKSFPPPQFSVVNQISQSPQALPRSCISSVSGDACADGKKEDKKKKRVHFAEDVMDPIGNSDEYRKLRGSSKYQNRANAPSNQSTFKNSTGKLQEQIPANRAALYNGILRDRVLHRVAYSY